MRLLIREGSEAAEDTEEKDTKRSDAEEDFVVRWVVSNYCKSNSVSIGSAAQIGFEGRTEEDKTGVIDVKERKCYLQQRICEEGRSMA